MSNEVWRQNRNREDRTKFEENPFHNYFKRFSAADTRLITITTLIVICALLCVWNILYPTQFQAVKWQTEKENGKKELQIPLKAMHKMEPTNEKRSKAKFIQVKHIVCVCDWNRSVGRHCTFKHIVKSHFERDTQQKSIEKSRSTTAKKYTHTQWIAIIIKNIQLNHFRVPHW